MISNNAAVALTAFLLTATACSGVCAEPRQTNPTQWAHQGQDRVAGEYLATGPVGINASDISRAFAAFAVTSVVPVPNTPGVFMVRLGKDPGLAALEAAIKGTKIKAIQPNFIYRINPKGPQ